MQSSDDKYYLTDVADTEQLFRLIQSIPSPKAEPFKPIVPVCNCDAIFHEFLIQLHYTKDKSQNYSILGFVLWFFGICDKELKILNV